MRPNLINRLKEEWNNLDPVDPLRGLLSDAIDALAEQPAMPFVPDAIHHTDTSETLEYIQGWNDCRQAVLAEQALDKMAENAREIGLDYEPVWGGGPSNKDYEDAMRLRRLNELAKPAQRKPLTDDEIHQCFLVSEQGQDGTEFRKAFARAIEAAHSIKENT